MASPATRIAGSFAAFGVLWIVLSDAFVFTMIEGYQDVWFVGTLKGLIFVGLSTLLVWWLAASWHRREQERASTEARLLREHSRALSSLQEAVFIVRERTIVDANQAVEEIFGYRVAELVGSSTEVLHVDREHYEEFGRRTEGMLEAGWSYEGEMVMRRRDGTVFPTSHTVTPLSPADGLAGGVVSVVRDISSREDAKRRRAEFYRHLQEARDRERARVARDLHDGLGQTLTGMKIDLSLIEPGVDDAATAELLASLGELVDDAMRTVRDLTTELHPAVLDELGLMAALRWLAKRNEPRFADGCLVESEISSLDLPPACQVHVFRIVQEALTNALRHADADSVKIHVREHDGVVEIEIADDGQWAAPDSEQATLGLVSMQERARILEGSLRVDRTSEGTRVRLLFARDVGAGSRPGLRGP